MNSKMIRQEEREIMEAHQVNANCNSYGPPMSIWPTPADTKPYWIYVPPGVPYPFPSPSTAIIRNPTARAHPVYEKEVVSRNPRKRSHPITIQGSDGQLYYREEPNARSTNPAPIRKPTARAHPIYEKEVILRNPQKRSHPATIQGPDGQVYYMEDPNARRVHDEVYSTPSTELKKKRKLQEIVVSPYRRPSLSFISLIIMALMKNPRGKASCSEIYQFIIDNFPFYATFNGHWKNAVRHNLSTNPFIHKIMYEGRKSDYFIDPVKSDEAITFLNSELDKEMNKIGAVNDKQ